MWAEIGCLPEIRRMRKSRARWRRFPTDLGEGEVEVKTRQISAIAALTAIAALEHVDFFRNRDSQISLSVIQDPCWGREASMDDATLS
jgi:hypothetical protein